MAHHWQTLSDLDVMAATANGPARRTAGWLLSLAATAVTVLLVWHFGL